MRLKLIDGSGQVNTLEIPGSVVFGSSVLVAMVSALATLATNYFVDVPTLRATQSNQASINEISRKRFQLELLQKALQAKTPDYRAASLRILVEAKLLDVPNETLARLTMNTPTIPEWVAESSGSSASGVATK